jgi:hypothetical protein
MPPKKPIATFATDEDLLKAVAEAQASLDFEDMRASPTEEAALVQALRSGMSEEEYFRVIEDEVLWKTGR